MGLNVLDVYGSGNIIKAEDLKRDGPLKGLIQDVRQKSWERDGKTELKLEMTILTADGGEKICQLNKSNARLLAAYFGNDTDAWIGKPLILYFDPGVLYAGKLVGGTKVKVPKQAIPAALQAPVIPDDDDLV